MRRLGVDDCVFADPTKVEYLELGDRLETLQAGDFGGMTNMFSLEFFGSPLTSLPEGVFDGLTSLRLMFLNDN